MRVFIAGGSGVIGRELVRALVEAGHKVTVLVRRPESGRALIEVGATPVVGDVVDRGAVVKAVRTAQPEAIINQTSALPDVFDARKLHEIYAANDLVRRESAANLLAAARGAGVQRFITQSAAFWYAPNGADSRSEAAPWWEDAPEPIGTAVRTLRAAEAAVLSESRMVGVALRFGHIYGPGTWYAPDGDIVRRVRKRAYPLIGSGDGVFSFVHVQDAVTATVAALADIPRGAYNVVDDEPAPVRAWLPALADAVAAPPPRRVPAFLARLAIGGPLVAWMSRQPGASNSAIRALGWTPRWGSWREGFAELLR